MDPSGIRKYYVGLGVIGLAVIGLTIYSIIISQGAKQDRETDKHVQTISSKLNAYISRNNSVPDSLQAIGVNDAPEEITYTKLNKESYKFCIKYHAASSYGSSDITSIVSGAFLGSYNTQPNDTAPDVNQTTLYPPYTHTKGNNCQTIAPYLSNYSPTYNLYQNSTYPTSTPISTTYNGSTSSPSVNTNAEDVKRETDIKSIYSQAEAYYAQNGKYPTLANLNDATWRASNMAGLNKESLRDPKSTNYTIVSKPVAGSYSYNVLSASGATCDNIKTDCSQYTLTATLSNGTTFTRSNLN